MTWFRIDDNFHRHPKVEKAGPAAIGIWAMAGSYASAYNTGGFVPRSFAIGIKNWRRATDRLVEVGLWEPAERNGEIGWQFHDWEHRNPTPEEVERDREAARERQRRHRRRDRDQEPLPDHDLGGSELHVSHMRAVRKPYVSRTPATDEPPHGVTDRQSERESESITAHSNAVSHGTPTRPDPY